ncbi:MAG: asparagine synthase (glutamine-hydrolyzing) [Deltaproteobacteria bacterium]|nr:MAG: asparagine synthase (glutamine-hydrolyzing) [Deltaproteobacteria bacterium]
MCGIAGIICSRASADPLRAGLDAHLQNFVERLRHRGPDASGTARTEGAGLAHTRLAILDLSPTGSQPMWSPDRRYVLAFNGEVYNFRRLREELEAAGERFAGNSDTEVVLRLLVREGDAALARFEGMFALALLDTRTDAVLLARDRAGQKPLYLARTSGGGWAFASELAPLLELPGIDAGIDREGLSHLLSFGFVPAPFSLRRGIRQLRPGTFVRLLAGSSDREKPYVSEPGPVAPALEGDVESLSRSLEDTLSASVRDHLVADVPVGVLLSGGVDSSTIAALAARHAGRLETFSVVHRDPLYDEREAARAVAEAIGSEHRELEISDEPLSEVELETLVDHHGDPFADTSSLAVLRLSREMRRHVTVALSGDGGDEVFAGYPRFAQLRLVSALARLPAPALGAARELLRRTGGERLRRAARAFHAAGMPRARRTVAFTTLFWPEEQARLLRPEWQAPTGPRALDDLLAERGAEIERDPVASAHWLEQRLILPDDMLTKVDRMSMAVSLEVRPPLLANGVLDFAARLPLAAKHSGATGKRVLRSLARRLVPPWVVDRPKRGFAVPLEQLGGRVYEEAARFALESRESPLRNLFRAEALAALAAELRSRRPSRDPEDSPYRRTQRRWLLTVLARSLQRYGC